MQSRNFLSRLILPFAGMIILVVGLYGIVIYLTGQRANHNEQIEQLTRLARLFREQLPADLKKITPEQSSQITSLASALATRITLIDSAGRVLFDTDSDPSTMENHNDRPEIIAARTTGSGSSVRYSHTLDQDAVYVARPLDPAKPNETILRLSYPRRVWTKMAVPPWALVVSGALSVAVLLAWLTLLLQRNWVHPVRDLSEAAGQMSAGDWSTRVSPRGAVELRDFSRRLNHAARQAEKQLADLDARRSELYALVDSLPDPIFLADANGCIALINRPAAKLLDLSPNQVLGKNLNDVLADPTLRELIKSPDNGDDRAEPSHAPRDIYLDRHGQRLYYQAVATRTRGGGVLLVLRNVTTMASAVQMKADFVANASHELRTPIAAIKMAFETLQQALIDDPEQTARCVSIVSGHLIRLEEMLADLLDLSRVENPDLKADLAPVAVDEIFSMVRGTMGTVARDKGVDLLLSRDNDASPDEFQTDKRLLNLVLRNLIENSVKFTPAGGRVEVRVGVDATDSTSIVLQVIDSGIGISAEHLERVFERFYQVDAARAAAAGRGTGLGLAIVKHAIHALGGTIDLQSTVGKGTTVTCRLPQHVMIEQTV